VEAQSFRKGEDEKSMQVSARILGQDYGLTAEEMNRVLVKQGFLQGIPGDYSVTQKVLLLP